MEKVYELSLKGKQALEAELHEARAVTRSEIVEKIKEAKSYGDLSENSEYDAAKSDQAKIEARITELEYILSHCVVRDDSMLTGDGVKTGVSVRVYNLTYEEETVYHIVSDPEADPFTDKISDEAPVGRALLNHKVDDIVTVETPGGNVNIKILEIFVS